MITLGYIVERGIQLVPENGNIRVIAPKGVLSEEILAFVRANKTELLEYLLREQKGQAISSSGSFPIDDASFSKWVSLPKLVIDFETYYDKGYSLKKLNYIEYVHDSRFKIHGVAIKHPAGRTEFRTDVSTAIKELQAAYGESLEKVCVVMHNAAFDAYVLKVKFDIVPANIIDTMLCTRLLHNPMQSASLQELAKRYSLQDKGDLEFMCAVESPTPEQLAKLSAYAINDVEITSQLAGIMIPKVGPAIEFWIMEHTIKMFLERSFSIDIEPSQNALREVDEHLNKELSDAGYTHAQISGNKTFVELLFAALASTGRVVPMKPGKKGPIPAISVDDEAMQELLDDLDQQVKVLAGLRILVKSIPNIKSKLEYLITAAALTGGHFPPLIEYHKAGPGRFAGGNGFNIQNMADPDKTSSEICRVAAGAPYGYTLVACDACQIEARILSYVSGQLDLHAEFAGKSDVYSEFASGVFGEKVMKTKGTSPTELRMNALRNVGKTAILGLGYSMGPERFIDSMKESLDGRNLFDNGVLTDTICRKIVSAYRKKYSWIKKFWGNCEEAFISAAEGTDNSLGEYLYFSCDADTVYIKLPSGRKLVYPDVVISEPRKKLIEYLDEFDDLKSFEICKPEITYGNNVNLYGGKITENIVQAIARDLLVDVIFRLETAGYPVICHIHDEVICYVKEAEANKCLERMICEWRRIPAWISGLVLDAEGTTGNNFGEI
ncbi:MAG: DNA polymerase [Lentisphaerae bacterium]|nr:DNA polymerase [Lentisphaerota bacterium]